MMPEPSLCLPPYRDPLPSPVYFRAATMPTEAFYPDHRHPWGEFVLVFSGVLELVVGQETFLAPPAYGLWLPPMVEHNGFNRQETTIGSLYVDQALACQLPSSPCMLVVSPLLRAMFDHLFFHPPGRDPSEAEQRLMRVAFDQLPQADCAGSYLPSTRDPLLAPILAAMRDDPADRRGVGEWARFVGCSERTLSRRFIKMLGLSLADWRQRLRVVTAIAWLKENKSIETIADDLGYGSASAFIVMFRRHIGQSPDEYRKGREGKSEQVSARAMLTDDR